jgi:hypothetical protein
MDLCLSLYLLRAPCPMTCMRPSSHFRPVAASATVSFPATISLTVAWMSEKSLNVVKGTFSFSQYVTRSDQVSSRLGEERKH